MKFPDISTWPRGSQLLKFAQRCAGVIEDGIFGPKTDAAIANFYGPPSWLPVCGIDVSHNNQGLTAQWFIDRYNEGVRFCYIKATEDQTWRDPLFVQYVKWAHAAGMLVGAYHFARPDTQTGDATAECAWFCKVIGEVAGLLTLPPCLDLETRGDAEPATHVAEPMTGTQLVAWALDFVARFHDDCILYTGAAFLGQVLHDNIPEHIAIWVARYLGGNAADPQMADFGVHRNWQVWQDSCKAFGGHTDRNWMYPPYWVQINGTA